MLIYAAISSLDGYIADADGDFDWSMPSEQVHAFVNDLQRPVGTYLYGRRLYETLVAWETWDGDTPAEVDYATMWRAAEKVVYSTTLDRAPSARTRIEREFDSDAVRRLASTGEVIIGGAALAAEAFRAGLIDEVHLFLSPVAVGAGTPALPTDLRLELELLDERRFDNGVVYVRYAVTT